MEKIAGKTVILTFPLNSGKDLVNSLLRTGINVVSLPMIKIIPLPADNKIKQTVSNLGKFTFLVFTSRNGVSFFFNTLKSLTGTYRIPDAIKIVVIGKATAKELISYGHKTGYISKTSSGEGLLEYMKDELLTKDDKVLLVLGKLAPGYLNDSLNKIAYVERLDIYDTVMPEYFDIKIINKIKNKEADLILFSSPSAFSNFITVSGIVPGKENISFAAIGNTTAAFIRNKGYKVQLVAGKPDFNIFTNDIIKFLNIK